MFTDITSLEIEPLRHSAPFAVKTVAKVFLNPEETFSVFSPGGCQNPYGVTFMNITGGINLKAYAHFGAKKLASHIFSQSLAQISPNGTPLARERIA